MKFWGLLFGMPRLDVVNILNLIHKMAAAMRPLSTTTVEGINFWATVEA